MVTTMWNVILNGGCKHFGSLGSELLTEIIKSPIIVDGRVIEDDDIENQSPCISKFNNIPIPFDQVWIERKHSSSKTSLVSWEGAFVRTTREGIFFRSVVFMFFYVPGKPVTFCGYSVVGYNGTMLNWDGMFYHPRVSGEYFKILSNACGCIIEDTFDTLQLLGCKNVSLKPHDNDAKQVRRAVKRHGGKPEDYKYYTLTVRPPGAKLDAPAQDIGIIPRHVCRGHFAEYGEQFGKGLLFGKLSGRFYVPPHLRGDKKNGVVEKDYKIPE